MLHPLPSPVHAAALALTLLAPPVASAQEADAPGQESASALSVELNGASSVEGGCRLTFLVENGLGADLAALSLETVVLTTEGVVEQLTLFDFGELPAGRPRVRQFDLAGLACEAVGQVLINGVTACGGAGVEAGACAAGLSLTSRGGIELIG